MCSFKYETSWKSRLNFWKVRLVQIYTLHHYLYISILALEEGTVLNMITTAMWKVQRSKQQPRNLRDKHILKCRSSLIIVWEITDCTISSGCIFIAPVCKEYSTHHGMRGHSVRFHSACWSSMIHWRSQLTSKRESNILALFSFGMKKNLWTKPI